MNTLEDKIYQMILKDIYKNMSWSRKSFGIIKNNLLEFNSLEYTTQYILNNPNTSEPYQFAESDWNYLRLYNIEQDNNSFCYIWNSINQNGNIWKLDIDIDDEDISPIYLLNPKNLIENPNKYYLFRILQILNEFNIKYEPEIIEKIKKSLIP